STRDARGCSICRNRYPSPTRRSSDLTLGWPWPCWLPALPNLALHLLLRSLAFLAWGPLAQALLMAALGVLLQAVLPPTGGRPTRSEEHTSELQSRETTVCRLLLDKKK